MTYARARLYLGISGVGTFVLLAAAFLIWQIPHTILPNPAVDFAAELLRVEVFLAVAVLLMVPFDWLGGYILPKLYGKTDQSPAQFAARWIRGVAIQYLFYVFCAAMILATSRIGNQLISLVAIFGLMLLLILLQSFLAKLLVGTSVTEEPTRVAPALNHVSDWGYTSPRLRFLNSSDPGFTGGIVGFPGFETVILPSAWLDRLSSRQLAIIITRRIEAMASGSRTLGLVFAFIWILLGISQATRMPGAGLNNAAELITTLCGFTLWTFLGLLILPTASRAACFAIDQRIISSGVSSTELADTLKILDGLQDDEPIRDAWIETIFHPVPSLNNRVRTEQGSSFTSWHIARNTLLFSWPCLGLLARVVHCNSGRPDLWALLPTD